MAQQISGPADLQRRCIIAIIEHLRQLGRTDSIYDLRLPSSIIQEVEGIYQYQQDLDVLISLPPFNRLRIPYTSYAAIPNTPPFNDHFRWISLKNGSSIKIDHRATATAQLDNLDPTVAPRFSIEFGFVLAATYCLVPHIRRLLPYWILYGSLSSTNPIVGYWTCRMGISWNPAPNSDLWKIRPQPRGSSDFWLAVIRSFWPIAERIGGPSFHDWIKTILADAMEYRYKSVVDFVWSQHTEDMRQWLVVNSTNGNYAILKSTIRTNAQNILVDVLERFENADARGATISVIVDEICKEFESGNNDAEMLSLFACVRIDRGRFSSEFVNALCWSLSASWNSLTSEKRTHVLNGFADFIRYAIEFGHVVLVICIWAEEEQPYRKFEMLFRDECAVFRTSCAYGHLELVELFWEWASNDQRCTLIRCKFGDALTSAARNGHVSIYRYLWENMDPQLAYEAIGMHGIDKISLSQLIIASSTNKTSDGPPHEVESFLLLLISNPSDGREQLFSPAGMKGILVAALLLGNGKALNVLVQRAKDSSDDPPILRLLMDAFDDYQRARLCSKLSTKIDIELCGFESSHIALGLQTMALHTNAHDDEEEEEDTEGGAEQYYGATGEGDLI